MKVKCPKCSKLQEVDPSASGPVFSCPDCGQQMKIKQPEPQTEEIAPEPDNETAGSEQKKPAGKDPDAGTAASGKTSKRAGRRRGGRSAARRRGGRSRRKGNEPEEDGDPFTKIKNKKMDEKNAVILVISCVLLLVVFIVAMTMWGDKKAEDRDSNKQPVQAEGGIDALEDKVYNDPTNRTLRFELADLLVRTGRYKDAYEHLGQLVDRDDIKAFNLYIQCALEMNKLEEAEMYYKRARKFAPKELATIEKLLSDYYYNNSLELPQAKTIEGFEAAVEKLNEADKISREYPNDNDKRKEVIKMVEECLAVFDRAKEQYPLNRLIDRQMVKANKILIMARKMTVTEEQPVKPAVKDDAPAEVDSAL